MQVEFYPEVPAQVYYEQKVTNGVVVQGGSNWDLSRSAIATPISAPINQVAEGDALLELTPYRPEHRMPARKADLTVNFAANTSKIPVSSQKALAALPKNVTVVVAGHADRDEKNPKAIAKARAQAVTAFLKKKGKKIEASRSFGSELPLAKSLLKAPENRRVEVFLDK